MKKNRKSENADNQILFRMIISIFIIISIFVFLFHSFLICYTLSVMDQSSSHILITSNYSEPHS